LLVLVVLAAPAQALVFDPVAHRTDCEARSDASAALARALAAARGGALDIPAGCRLLLASPGPGGAAITIPGSTHLACEPGATFVLARRACSGGRHPGAACTTGADCAGGRCVADAGARAFAEGAADDLFTVFRADDGSTGVGLAGCAVQVHGADDYLRCVGGGHDGRPCEQRCDGAAPTADVICQTDGDCRDATHPHGVCLAREDCAAGGGTCTGEPGSPVGAGRVTVVDFARASFAAIERNELFDHRRGGVSFAVGDDGRVVDNASTRTVNTYPKYAPAPTIAVETGIRAGGSAVVRANTVRGVGGIQIEDGFSLVAENTVAAPVDRRGAVGIALAHGNHRVLGNQVGGWNCVRGDPATTFNVLFTANRCFGGRGAKVVITGSGWQVANNYLAWGSGADGNGEPIVWIGDAGEVGEGDAHAVIVGNLLFSDQAPTSYVKFADPGERCTRGARRGRTCAGGCPGGVCAPTAHLDGTIVGNSFFGASAASVHVDAGGLTSGATTLRNWTVAANHFLGGSMAVRLPDVAALAERVTVVGNGFAETDAPAADSDPAGGPPPERASSDAVERCLVASVGTEEATLVALPRFDNAGLNTVVHAALGLRCGSGVRDFTLRLKANGRTRQTVSVSCGPGRPQSGSFAVRDSTPGERVWSVTAEADAGDDNRAEACMMTRLSHS
jgi:hypothetical protein